MLEVGDRVKLNIEVIKKYISFQPDKKENKYLARVIKYPDQIYTIKKRYKVGLYDIGLKIEFSDYELIKIE